MATITGTHVNFVKVPTMAKFSDIEPKVDGTVYFIVDDKKIYLDGVMYGFNLNDIDGMFLKLTGGKMSGTINMDGKMIDNATNIRFSSTTSGSARADMLGELSKVTIGVVDNTDVYDPVKKNYVLGRDLFTLPNVRLTGVADGSANRDAVNFKKLNELVIDKIGAVDGIATLDDAGKVPSEQLPSYVDDVEEYPKRADFPNDGESGKLYLAIDTARIWRWTGSTYAEISPGSGALVLGETQSTAYRGDRGKDAYDHSKLEYGNPHKVTAFDINLGLVQNYAIANKAEAEAGTVDDKYMTPERTKEAITELAPRLAWEVVS